PLITVATEEPGAINQAVGVQPVVLANGHLVVVYPDVQGGAYTFVGAFKAVRSTDGGQTWSDPVTISQSDPYFEENNGLRAPNIPAVAVSTAGTVWLAFQDQRFTHGRNDILISRSKDQGQTWTDPVN